MWLVTQRSGTRILPQVKGELCLCQLASLGSLLPPVLSPAYLRAAAVCNNKQHGPNMPANLQLCECGSELKQGAFYSRCARLNKQHGISTSTCCGSAVACRRCLVLMRLRMHRQVPDKEDVACRRGSYIEYYKHGFKLGFLLHLLSLYLKRKAHGGGLEMLVASDLQHLGAYRTSVLFWC